MVKEESEECVIDRRIMLSCSLDVRAKLIIMMFDNFGVDNASFGVLITKSCTDFESWH